MSRLRLWGHRADRRLSEQAPRLRRTRAATLGLRSYSRCSDRGEGFQNAGSVSIGLAVACVLLVSCARASSRSWCSVQATAAVPDQSVRSCCPARQGVARTGLRRRPAALARELFRRKWRGRNRGRASSRRSRECVSLLQTAFWGAILAYWVAPRLRTRGFGVLRIGREEVDHGRSRALVGALPPRPLLSRRGGTKAA